MGMTTYQGEGLPGADHNADIGPLASLAEPVRRALYEFAAGSSRPVSRDEAAAAVDVSRQVAAYHLDRLAEDGLLDYEFRRLGGRDGPGAGRPSKLYRRSNQVYEVTVPPRRYELAARILLDALREGAVDRRAVAKVAQRAGNEIGVRGLDQALSDLGYEPAIENGQTRFRNCPFHVLKEQDRETTCELNLALVTGIIEGSGAGETAVLEPEDGYCCVRIGNIG